MRRTFYPSYEDLEISSLALKCLGMADSAIATVCFEEPAERAEL